MELEEEQKTQNFPNQDQNNYENIEIIPQIPLSDQQIQKYTEQAKQFKQLYDNFTSITFEKDPNTEYFLLSTKFLKRWKALVSYEEAILDKPLNKFAGGPQIFEKINQDLVVNVGNENISERLNELTQQKQWNEKFQGIPIKRVCHKINDQKIIEVRPLRFNIVFLDHQYLKQMDMQKLTDFKYKYLIQLSKYLSVQEMYDYLQNFLEQKLTSSYIKQNYEIRVWQIDESISEKEFFMKTQKTCQNTCNVDYKIKVDGNYINPEQKDVQNISELNLTAEQLVMVEYRDDKYDSKFCFYNSQVPEMGKCENCTQIKILKHPCSCQQALYCSESCKQKDWVFHEGRCTAPVNEGEKPKQKKDSKLGITGLNNIGNTCFMNSGLQCLSNCFELTQYFLSDLYENDLNIDAPLGTKGELTQQYGRLIYNLWFGNQDSYVPRNFKKILSTYHKIFQGIPD
ncbi:hypothetical protein PPERSA_08835 [Pseudocohnilembus persalinus]|uniref:ubiquitinyl hydrolase 1 n=1 Tax=Pseudocohnilembus persalinus TaxID=266149 RepID=A0A0V0R3Q2_PSEPJ|nr:hypothetical protein PPERSA_08835 [Pseudocohnilembus persalinus]|eukprot:KRX09119.1 hypothetical protein PPERSA_08835 [Pseudocohnilembus persalinus]